MPDVFPIHVVICTYDRCDLLGRTLRSLAAVRRPAGFERFWVIENGTDAGARQTCAEFAEQLPLAYRHVAQKGKSNALQKALAEIGRGLVVFTDDDVRVEPDWLEHYAAAACEHGPGAFYGGPLNIDYERPPPEWMRQYLPASATGWRLDPPDQPIEKACFLGANYGAFVETLVEVGGFIPHLGVGAQGNPIGEEFEIQDRMLAHGCNGVYLPEAAVWHYVPRQRCSMGWVLGRHERVWFTNGLTDGKRHLGRRIGGVPGWMWRRLAGLGVQALAANLIPDARRRFERKKMYYQWKGYLRGARLAYLRSREGQEDDRQNSQSGPAATNATESHAEAQSRRGRG